MLQCGQAERKPSRVNRRGRVVDWEGVHTFRPNEVTPAAPRDRLGHGLRDAVEHPHLVLLRPWNWKAAVVSAVFRAGVFLAANRHDGRAHAVETATAEVLVGFVCSGLLGALTQRLRDTRPLWATLLVVWIAMPAAMVAVEAEAQRLVHTQHLRVGLLTSFVVAAVTSGFTWFAMRHGALLQGEGDDSLRHDLRTLPGIILEFVIWPLRRMGLLGERGEARPDNVPGTAPDSARGEAPDSARGNARDNARGVSR